MAALKDSGLGQMASESIAAVGAGLPWATALILLFIILSAAFQYHRGLEWLVRCADGLNEWVGHAVAWLTLGCVLVCFAVVVLRYAFEMGFIWLQELYVWQHAAVFMVGAGYTFLKGGHVRVDVVYCRLQARTRAWIDIAGSLVFLFPWLVVLVGSSVPFLSSSWRIYEWSDQAHGMPGFFLLKSCIWLFAFLVGAQGLALMSRSLLFLSGREEYGPAASAT